MSQQLMVAPPNNLPTTTTQRTSQYVSVLFKIPEKLVYFSGVEKIRIIQKAEMFEHYQEDNQYVVATYVAVE